MSLYVQESGEKTNETVLFLHGLGVSGWMWTDQINSLQQSYHCLNVDLPGNGESFETEWLSFADTADQLAEVIKQRANGGRAHIVGLSLGGYSCLHLLQRHPELIRSVVVSGVTCRPLSNPWFFRLVSKVLSRALKRNWVIGLSAKLMQLPDEVIPLYRRDSQRLSRECIRRIYAEVLSYELPLEFEEFPHRVLAVAGDAEAKMVKKSLSEVPARFRNGRSYLAPKAHHGWNAEHPELFTSMIAAWIEESEVPSELSPVGAVPEPVQTEGIAA